MTNSKIENENSQILINKLNKIPDVNVVKDELKKAVPALTDEVLELLFKWFEARQKDKFKEQLEIMKNDIGFQKLITSLIHSEVYIKPQS